MARRLHGKRIGGAEGAGYGLVNSFWSRLFRRLRQGCVQATFVIYSIAVIFPMIWLMYTAFKPTSELFASAWSLPSVWKFDNFVEAWDEAQIGAYFWNSVFVTTTTLLVQLFVGSMASYSLAKYRFRGSGVLYYFFLAGLMFPIFLGLVPLFFLVKELGLLDRKECGKGIRLATRFEKLSLPGDYVAWHVGLDGPGDEAVKLGFEMLPPLRAGLRAVYNKGERTAGAMLLALSARTDAQRAAAIERIALRLKYEDDFMTLGAYRCALLVLGQNEQFKHVRTLRKMSSFPRRRAITALLASGDADTIDWLLLNPRRPIEDAADMLVTLRLGEVLDRTVATLGGVDLAGDGQMQQWQARLMRHRWAVGRGGLVVGLRR